MRLHVQRQFGAGAGFERGGRFEDTPLFETLGNKQDRLQLRGVFGMTRQVLVHVGGALFPIIAVCIQNLFKCRHTNSLFSIYFAIVCKARICRARTAPSRLFMILAIFSFGKPAMNFRIKTCCCSSVKNWSASRMACKSNRDSTSSTGVSLCVKVCTSSRGTDSFLVR